MFDGPPLEDTWIYDGRWHALDPREPHPSARADAAIAYDPRRAEIMLFGGTGEKRLNDTWIFDGQAWYQRTPESDPIPSERSLADLVADPNRDGLVLSEGIGLGGRSPEDPFWLWDGAAWTQLNFLSIRSAVVCCWSAKPDPAQAPIPCALGSNAARLSFP